MLLTAETQGFFPCVSSQFIFHLVKLGPSIGVNIILIKKIKELTLYIQQQKEIDELRKRDRVINELITKIEK